MKVNRSTCLILLFIAILAFLFDVEARGGGGRGGGGRGGNFNSGRTLSRAPTMERSDYGARRDLGDMNARSREQVQQYANQASAMRTVNPGSSLSSDANRRVNTAQGIRQRADQGDWNGRNLFNDRFWGDHNYNPYYRYAGANYWRAATWAGAASWLGSTWSSPYYYDSGSYYPVTQDDVSAAPQYYSDVSSNAAPAPQQQPQDPQAASSPWMPMGIFALTDDTPSPSDPNMYLELALNKDGTLAGSYFNSSSNQVYPVTGVVDKATQQAVWKTSSADKAPIFTTGLYNLTQTQTPVSVHYNDGTEQNWLMVRMQGPSK